MSGLIYTGSVIAGGDGLHLVACGTVGSRMVVVLLELLLHLLLCLSTSPDAKIRLAGGIVVDLGFACWRLRAIGQDDVVCGLIIKKRLVSKAIVSNA